MTEPSSTPPPKPPPAESAPPFLKTHAVVIIAGVFTVILSVASSYLMVFLTLGNWVRADVQDLRKEVQELRKDVNKVATLERDAKEQRKQLENWWKNRFGELCHALGHYDQNQGACILQNGQVLLKYELPYLP